MNKAKYRRGRFLARFLLLIIIPILCCWISIFYMARSNQRNSHHNNAGRLPYVQLLKTQSTSESTRGAVATVSVKDEVERCSSRGFSFIENVPTRRQSSGLSGKKPNGIPKQVFQTCKSKCVVSTLSEAAEEWKFGDGWGYYLYDDSNVDEFFQEHANDFPLLGKIASRCFVHGTLKADLFRYLVLWVSVAKFRRPYRCRKGWKHW